MKETKFWKCEECKAVLEEVADCNKGPVCVPHCCGAPMVELQPNSQDASREKHVPVISFPADGGTLVAVGSQPHPMLDAHYIEWIELIHGARVCRKYLRPGDQPEAHFCFRAEEGTLVRAYCNLHGLWIAKIEKS